MSFVYKRKIFSYECDIYGHLNNANYLHVFEEARSEALDETGISISFLNSKGISIFVTESTIKYKKSLEKGEVYKVESKILKINRLRSTWSQQIFDSDGNLCCDFILEAVFVKGRKPGRIDNELLELFKKFI